MDNNKTNNIRMKSLGNSKDGYGDFICTGTPGTGFYTRELFKDTPSNAVPFSMPEGSYGIFTRCVEKPVDPELLKKREQNLNWQEVKKGSSCFSMILVVVLFFISLYHLFEGHFLMSFVFFAALVLYKVIENRYLNRWKTKKLKEVSVEKSYVAEPVFQKPAIENIDEYYISTAQTLLSNSSNDIQRSILENFIHCVKNPGEAPIYDSAKKLKISLSFYGDLCGKFEELIRSNMVLSLLSPFSNQEHVALNIQSTSKASLYVGVFNFIASKYDTPVIDFGSFQVYLYPMYVIKAYDSFTFELIDYKDFALDFQDVEFTLDNSVNVSDSLLLFQEKNFNSTYKFGRISMRIAGMEYSILVSNYFSMCGFKQAWDKFYEKVLAVVD